MKHVVVGVSPTTRSPDALRWGWEHARLMDVPVRAVLAWRPPRPAGAPGGRPPLTTYADEDPAEVAADLLRTAITEALGSTEGIDCRPARGGAVQVLLEESRDAHLLVLGAPRPGRLASVRTGLVSPQLVLRAGCPVTVMPSAPHVEF
jgi:nucleotide-binding universal stress UspA family protein